MKIKFYRYIKTYLSELKTIGSRFTNNDKSEELYVVPKWDGINNKPIKKNNNYKNKKVLKKNK